MEIYHGLERVPDRMDAAVATIGNYDGIHLGHRAVLDTVRDDAKRVGGPSLVITFDPHPVAVVRPEAAPALLCTRRQKIDRLTELGLDAVLFLAFDEATAALDGREWLERELLPDLPLKAVHVGANFRFGRGRRGDLHLLRAVGADAGFEVVGHPAVEADGEPISSSRIRTAVREGRVADAARWLGRAFALDGTVVRGAGRGRELEFPTANLDVHNELLPARGVYVTETRALGRRWPSITNVGVRPTFDGRATVVETHCLDAEIDLYDERLEVAFLENLRAERRFPDAGALVAQIRADRDAALAWFRREGAWT